MIIAFNGEMGVGKTTAIGVARNFFSYNTHLVKFAGPLYEMQEYIYERISSVHTRPSTFTKDRKLLQWLGTDWGRATVGPNIWVDLWKASMEDVTKAGLIGLCDDCRFDNEAEAVRASGGVVIKIVSDKNKERIDTTSGISAHASEAGIAAHLVDYVIVNNGTKEEFEAELTELLNNISRGKL